MPFDHEAARRLCSSKFETQQAAADAIGVKREYLARLLSGKVPNPELFTIERFARAVGCKPAKLIKEV